MRKDQNRWRARKREEKKRNEKMRKHDTIMGI